MCVKVQIEGVMVNVVSGYALELCCELEGKNMFWNELDDREHPQGKESGTWTLMLEGLKTSRWR